MIRAHAREAPGVAVARPRAYVANWVAALPVAALFLTFTLSLAVHLSIGQDEAYSLHTAGDDFVSALRRGVTYEAQAPLYFGVLQLWHSLNGSVFFARLLSIGFAVGTLAYAWLFAARYLRGIAPHTALLFVACSPFVVWASIEIRPYPAAGLATMALLYYLFRGWIDEDVHRPARAWFVAIAVLGIYTHYYVALFVMAGTVAVFALRRRGALRSYLVAAAAIALASLPILSFLPLQLHSYSALAASSRMPAYAILLAVLDFVLPHHAIATWIHRPLENAVYLLCIVALAIALIRLTRLGTVARTLLIVTAALTVLFGALIGAGLMPVTFPRQTVVLFPSTLFALLALVAGIRPVARTAVLNTLVAVYTVFAVAALWSDYHDLSKPGDWQRVGRFLSAQVADGDAVAAFDTELTLPLGYYFSTANVLSIPRPLPFDHFDENAFVIDNEREVAAVLKPVVQRHARVWLVENDLCHSAPIFYGCAYLQGYLAEHFTVRHRYAFNRSSVTELIARR